jgi:hypothetical protein
MFGGPNSLLRGFNSLFGLKKFPVLVRREFVRKCAKVRLDLILKSRGRPRIRGNSLFICLLAGNSGSQRRVRGRLPPPPSSPSLQGSWSDPSRRPNISRQIRGVCASARFGSGPENALVGGYCGLWPDSLCARVRRCLRPRRIRPDQQGQLYGLHECVLSLFCGQCSSPVAWFSSS